MKNERKSEHELITELESVYQKVYEKEALLKEHGHREGNGPERYQTMSDVRDSEVRYRRLFETAQDGILILDAESGAITDANPYIINRLGYSLQDLLRKRLWEIGAFADVKDCKAAFEELQQKEYIRYKDLPLKTKDGQRREVEFISNVYLVDGKKVIQCNIRDITDLRQTEEQLRVAQSTNEGILNSISETIYILDENGVFLYVNFAAEKMYGYPRDYFIGRTSEFLSAPGKNSLVEIADHIRQAFNGQSRNFEFWGVKKDGTIFPKDVVLTPGIYFGKKVVIAVARDITERKRTEKSLRESNEKFQQLADNITDAFWIRSPDMSEVHYVSPAFERIWGRSVKSLYANPHQWVDFILHEDRERVIASFAALSGDGPSLDIEYRIVRPSGEIRWVHVRGFQVRNTENKLCRHIGIVTDITERKRTEDQLQFKGDLLAAVDDAVIAVDIQQKITYWNLGAERLYGWTSSEALGRNILDVTPTQTTKDQATEILDSLLSGKSWSGEFTVQGKTGNPFPAMVTDSPILNKNGELIGVIGVSKDITDRKQAEKQIALLAQTLKSVTESVCITDLKDTILFVNNAFLKAYGYKEHEILGKNINVVRSPNNPPEVSQGIQDAALTGGWSGELLNRKKDGSDFSVLLSTSFVRDENEQVIALVGVATDITEHKLAESALQESNKQFQTLFEISPDAILLIDPRNNWPIVNCNTAACQMNGYTKDELIGQSIDLINLEQSNPAERAEYLEHIRLNGILRSEAFHRRKDGSLFQIELSTSLITLEGHELVLGIDRDITDRKRVELHLKESEERYRRLVEFSPNAIMVHSFGKFVYVNPAAIALLGAKNGSELIGKPILDILHKDHKESAHRRITTGMIENKTLPLVEEKFLRLDGGTIDVEVVSLQIEYNGKPAMQDVVRDITDQKKLQLELLQSQKIQSIGTLAGGIAHDFNNILGIILGYITLFEKNNLNALKQSESIAIIKQAVQRGASLVRQILTFARKTVISFEPLSLADIIQELITMLQQTFPKIITFKKNFAKDIPFILADRTQVHQAILNLCVNARDAMPNGGSITIDVDLHTRRQLKEQFPAADQELYVCISVTDTGEGMDEATSRRVFDPFFTTKPQGKGTGLGLSVVYGVVQAHQGFINVQSKLGNGTTFRLYFPVPKISEKPIESQQVGSFEIGGTESILIVEDEEPLLGVVRFMLESKGYKVFAANNGAEAVEVYKKHREEIALVLTDMGLPIMTGAEEFKKLKEINPNVKIIFASGFFDPEVKSELLKSGVKDFIQKPYMPNEILRTVREVLDNKSV